MKFFNYNMILFAITLVARVLFSLSFGISQETNKTNFSTFSVISDSAKVSSIVKRNIGSTSKIISFIINKQLGHSNHTDEDFGLDAVGLGANNINSNDIEYTTDIFNRKKCHLIS